MQHTQWNAQWKSFNQRQRGEEFINKVIVWTMMMMITDKRKLYCGKWNWDATTTTELLRSFSHSLISLFAQSTRQRKSFDWWLIHMACSVCVYMLKTWDIIIETWHGCDQFTWVASSSHNRSESENSTRHTFAHTQQGPRAILIGRKPERLLRVDTPKMK